MDEAPQAEAPPRYQTVSPYLLYEDADRAVEYLVTAFGFRERDQRFTATDPEGQPWVFAQRVGGAG